ncbi:MAG: GIY-YIG nuclease family protein [bacterium]
MKTYYFYILTDKNQKIFHLDISDDVLIGVNEFRSRDEIDSPKKNKFEFKLVYFEKAGNITEAIKYKKQLQKWNDVWKKILIEKFNPGWKDLYPELMLSSKSREWG